jgi:hypothetical protein
MNKKYSTYLARRFQIIINKPLSPKPIFSAGRVIHGYRSPKRPANQNPSPHRKNKPQIDRISSPHDTQPTPCCEAVILCSSPCLSRLVRYQQPGARGPNPWSQESQRLFFVRLTASRFRGGGVVASDPTYHTSDAVPPCSFAPFSSSAAPVGES